MRTIDDIPMSAWPRPLPLDVTPAWQQLLLGRPLWRFRFEDGWVYLTDAQYNRVFRRRS